MRLYSQRLRQNPNGSHHITLFAASAIARHQQHALHASNKVCNTQLCKTCPVVV